MTNVRRGEGDEAVTLTKQDLLDGDRPTYERKTARPTSAGRAVILRRIQTPASGLELKPQG